MRLAVVDLQTMFVVNMIMADVNDPFIQTDDLIRIGDFPVDQTCMLTAQAFVLRDDPQTVVASLAAIGQEIGFPGPVQLGEITGG